MKIKLLLSALAAAALFSYLPFGTAQVAGSTTLGVTALEVTQIAAGWSVKKSILGKTVYTDGGESIGKVQDLIITPDNNVSYAIVGAGGFIGIGRHDVAIPIAQLKDKNGRIIMAGATKGVVKTMPRFEYANTGAEREKFVAEAELDIARAKAKLVQLKDDAATASVDVKSQMNMRATSVRLELKTAEEKLAMLKSATKSRWKEFQAEVSAATQRLRKSIADATAQ
jgi:sporulation protein YlmC with PRC-barrel domain